MTVTVYSECLTNISVNDQKLWGFYGQLLRQDKDYVNLRLFGTSGSNKLLLDLLGKIVQLSISYGLDLSQFNFNGPATVENYNLRINQDFRSKSSENPHNLEVPLVEWTFKLTN